MTAQSGATARNSNVEFFIDFVLRNAFTLAQSENLITGFTEPVRQASFKRDDCSDVFDHHLTIEIQSKVSGSAETSASDIKIWGQTTCYKGNTTGRPEPNKTYEIRETLIEALTLRKWLKAEGTEFRTLHFTVGPSDYSYGWMRAAKDSAFDLSMYPKSNDSDKFFKELDVIMTSHTTEVLRRQALQKNLDTQKSVLSKYAINYTNNLLDWIRKGMPRSSEACHQADLLNRHQSTRAKLVDSAVQAASSSGADLKPAFLKFIGTGESQDPVMITTANALLKEKPFLKEALSATRNWAEWISQDLPCRGSKDLGEYVSRLWSSPKPRRLIWRRILLRIHSRQGVNYVQDTNIEGVTEHNLYAGDHNKSQTHQFVSQINSNCIAAGINTPFDLAQALSAPHARQLVKSSLAYEAKNGTSLKPSFLYVQNYLMPKFRCVPINTTNIASPKPYYEYFTDATVNPYTNLMAVISSDGKSVLAILKAKYFNGPEFPRRAKEEGYVGLTLKYKRTAKGYEERYPGIPLIMFVDMAHDLCAPNHAIRALVRSGWDAHFSLASLKSHLERLDKTK
jgi:hypothetical protein